MRDRRDVARSHLDEQLAGVDEVVPDRPPQGWVRAIREALGMSTTELADRLGVVQSRVVAIEQSEAEGRLQLDTLRRAAAALSCRLVYVLVPDRPLQEMVFEQARAKARAELAPVAHTMRLEDQQLPDRLAEEQVEELAGELVDRRGLWAKQ